MQSAQVTQALAAHCVLPQAAMQVLAASGCCGIFLAAARPVPARNVTQQHWPTKLASTIAQQNGPTKLAAAMATAMVTAMAMAMANCMKHALFKSSSPVCLQKTRTNMCTMTCKDTVTCDPNGHCLGKNGVQASLHDTAVTSGLRETLRLKQRRAMNSTVYLCKIATSKAKTMSWTNSWRLHSKASSSNAIMSLCSTVLSPEMFNEAVVHLLDLRLDIWTEKRTALGHHRGYGGPIQDIRDPI